MDNLGPKVQRLMMDCREIEPTPQGFQGALGSTLKMEEPVPNLNSVIARLRSSDKRTVLAIDTYETFGLMDTWLRQEFIPSLTENVFTIIAGREVPNPAWITSPGWQDLFREIELRALSGNDVQLMLESRGLSHSQIDLVKRYARGYPLALEMAAAAIRTQPDLKITEGPPPRILQQLTQVFWAGLPPEIMEAVEATSSVRRVTEPLLKALLNNVDVREIFNNLLSLPFIDATTEGLIFQDVVRDTISKDLTLRDPERYHTYRKRAYSHFTRESHRAVASTLWQYTADLLYMIENPITRGAFFPEGATDLRVEPATAGDAVNIHEITRTGEPPESFRLIKLWWQHHPETFSIVKTSDGQVQAFYIIFEPDKVSQSILEQDPFTLAWLRHLADNPIAEEERVLFCRRWLDRETGEIPTPAVSACFLDIKRVYMELRPSLRRTYYPVNDLSIFEPILFPLGFTSLETASVTIDGITYHTLMNDFGPSSVDGWLAKIVGQELGVDIATKQGRMLVTILFTDIVNSTEKAITLGDKRWRELLERHHKLVRKELTNFHGHEVDTAGDGFFAIFDKPANAIQCASAVCETIGEIGIDIRAGLHLGECEIMEDGVRGITVHIGARVASKAQAGEILVSSTLKEASAGSDIRFEGRGSHELKGIPGEWNLFAVSK
jgi:class 3 adenylate cyclase